MAPISDEDRELIEQAHDALSKLLDPLPEIRATSTLRDAQDMLKQMLDFIEIGVDEATPEARERQRGAVDEAQARPAERAQWLARHEAWHVIPWARTESLVLEALGEGRLLMGELWPRFESQFDLAEVTVHRENLYKLVRVMVREGQLDRTPEQVGKRVQYRYYRKRGLAGPIADLEAAYRDESAREA